MSGKASGVTIRVEGLVEFQRALREADKKLPREIKRALDVIGRDILVPLIIRNIEAKVTLPLGDRKSHKFRTGKLERSVRAVSQQRAGIVKEGVASVPWAGWWEFGGSTHSSRGNTSREFIHEGRAMHPALIEAEPAIRHETEHVLGELVQLLDRA